MCCWEVKKLMDLEIAGDGIVGWASNGGWRMEPDGMIDESFEERTYSTYIRCRVKLVVRRHSRKYQAQGLCDIVQGLSESAACSRRTVLSSSLLCARKSSPFGRQRARSDVWNGSGGISGQRDKLEPSSVRSRIENIHGHHRPRSSSFRLICDFLALFNTSLLSLRSTHILSPHLFFLSLSRFVTPILCCPRSF